MALQQWRYISQKDGLDGRDGHQEKKSPSPRWVTSSPPKVPADDVPLVKSCIYVTAAYVPDQLMYLVIILCYMRSSLVPCKYGARLGVITYIVLGALDALSQVNSQHKRIMFALLNNVNSTRMYVACLAAQRHHTGAEVRKFLRLTGEKRESKRRVAPLCDL